MPLPLDVTGSAAPVDVDSAPARWRRLDWLVFAGYLVVAAIKLALHPMWRDELQSWDLARSSTGLGELLSRVRWEQHPPLWYVLCWLCSRIDGNPRTLQVLTFLLVAATTVIVLRFAPWPRPLRWLFLAGYFPLFEWSTLSRPYVLTLLLAIIGAELLRRRRLGVPLGLVVAALILTDDAYGTVVAAALLAAVFVGRGRWHRGRRWPAVVLGVVAVALAGLSDLPPAGYGGPTLGLSGRGIQAALEAPFHALVPIPDLVTEFWNTNLFDVAGLGFVAIAGLLLVVSITSELRLDRGARAIWVVGLLGTVGVQALTNLPFDRFIGTIVVVLVCAFWVHGPTSSEHRQRLLATFTVLLVLQLPGALVALVETSVHPFSQSEAAAATVARLPGTIVAVRDEAAVPVAAYANRPLDLASGNPPATYIVWDQARLCAGRRCNPVQLLENAMAEAQTTSSDEPTYLLTDFEIPPGTPDVVLLRSWRHAVVNEEDYWLYAVTG